MTAGKRIAVGRQDVRPAEGARAGRRPGYYKVEGDRVFDEDGWFDTGDVATIDHYGYMQITDRSKDVIKSGGEWISSIDLENLAVGHPKVAEAAVIGVSHPKWDERPLLVIVLKKGESASQGRYPRLHAGQDRQMVDAGRRGLRRRNPAHRHRQDPEDQACANGSRITCCRRQPPPNDSLGSGFPLSVSNDQPRCKRDRGGRRRVGIEIVEFF